MPKRKSEQFSFADEPAPESKQPQKDPAQQLLTWLQKCGRQTITTRDVRNYAPKNLRNRESAINSINILVRHGWLVPATPSRRDRPEWTIVRQPTIDPQIAE
jgi:hypothetical protein